MLFKSTVGCNVMTKHIYICHVGTYIGAYNPYTGEIRYATSDKFVPFVKKILDEFPEYSPHNIINDGVAEVIRKKILIDIALKELQKTR